MTEYQPYRVPFSQRRWVQEVLPWVAASFVHISVFTIAMILVPKFIQIHRATSEEQIVIPDTALAEDGKLGGIPNPGLGTDPSRSAQQENNPSANDSHGWAQRSSQTLSQDLSAPAAQNSDLIASGAQNEAGAGKDNSVLSYLGSQGGGDIANFGPRGGGGGIGPKSRIFGSGSNVRSVIYVCDGSGSMLSGKDDVLKREMKTDVASLAPIQSFNTLFFQEGEDGRPFNAVSNQLMMANPKDKTTAYGYLDHIEFRRGTNPLPAMTEAFREKPELIYLLTDGEFDNPSSDVVLAKIDQLNLDKKIKINTRLLLQSKTDASDARFEDIMNQIATDNGGNYRKFYADEW